MLCISLREKDIANIERYARSADLLEIRSDLIKGFSLFGKNFLFTTDDLRLAQDAIDSGCGYIDLPAGKKIDRKQAKLIYSFHDHKKTSSLEELESKYLELSRHGPDFVKIVTYANTINDCFTIFRLLQGKDNLVAHCMGPKGVISRLLAEKFGSKMSYVCIDEPIAPGQLSLADFNTYNRAKKDTEVLGVIGEHAENSKSRFMHNANFKAKNLDYIYVPFKVLKEDLGEFMENFRKFRFSGCAVTVPHKQEIIKYLDVLDQKARQIGAVNTLVSRDGKITGYNTDHYGAVEALKEKTDLKGKRTLVIGAGGAARAVVYGLKKEGAKITIMNRTRKKAGSLAEEFNIRSIDTKEDLSIFDIIINATSVGMNPTPDATILKKLPEGKLVMDIVYNPINTRFIGIAKKAGCMTITGDRMLLHQAIGQYRLWTGQMPDFALMEEVLLQHLGD